MPIISSRGFGVITAAFFTLSIAYAIRYGYGMLLPGMLVSLEITKTQAGVIYASYFIAYTIFSPILGALSDRFDSRMLLSVFSAILAVGALLMAYVTTVWEAALVFSIAGVGHAACWAPVVSLVQQWVDDKHRGAALSIATLGSGIGIAAWGFFLPVIVGKSNWQAGWIHLGLFGFFVAGLNFLLIRNPINSDDDKTSIKSTQPQTRKNSKYPWFEFLGDGNLWVIGFSYLAIGFAVLVPFTFLGAYASEELQLPYATATHLFSIIAVTGLLGKLTLGIFSDRWGRIPVMMVCGLLVGSGCWGIINMASLQMKICSVVLVGIGFGAVWPVYAAAAIDFFPKSAAGSVLGIWTVFLGVGSILSPLVCGWSIDFSGSYRLAFNIGCVVAIISAVMLVPLAMEQGRNRGKVRIGM